MATNLVNKGAVIEFTAGATINSGDPVVIGTLLGVALADVASGAVGQAFIEGVFTLPKVTADDLAVGESVQFDVSSGEIADSGATPASGDLSNCGIVMAAAGNGATTVDIKINVAGASVTA